MLFDLKVIGRTLFLLIYSFLYEITKTTHLSLNMSKVTLILKFESYVDRSYPYVVDWGDHSKLLYSVMIFISDLLKSVLKLLNRLIRQRLNWLNNIYCVSVLLFPYV